MEAIEMDSVSGNPKRTLRDIVDELTAHLEGNEGEVDDTIEQLQLSIAEKIDSYAAVYHKLNAEADACREMARYYNAKVKTREDNAAKLRHRLLEQMDRIGLSRIRANTVSAIVSTADALQVTDETLIPEVFHKHTVSVNNAMVKQAIKEGQLVPGAQLTKARYVVFR